MGEETRPFPQALYGGLREDKKTMGNIKPRKDDELKWIIVDFDNTIANNSGYPDFEPLEPTEGAKEALEEITRRGFKIIVWTARHYSDYEKIEHWLEQHEIPFRGIVCGKVLGKYMIDDVLEQIE